MGGIYLRYALPFLVKKLQNIELLNYISLASPHLGISGNLTKYPNWLLNMTWTGSNLMCENLNYGTSIVDLSSGEFLEALSKFKNRIVYAPIFNDGMVSFPSAAISLTYPNQYKSEIATMNTPMKVNLHGEERILNCSKGDIIILEEDKHPEGWIECFYS